MHIVELLIRYGAEIDIKYDKTGATPLDLAIFNGILHLNLVHFKCLKKMVLILIFIKVMKM